MELENEVQKIAIDIGYGDTKVMTKDGVFKFASAVAHKAEARADFSSDAPIDEYTIGNKKYIVGDKAVSNAVSTRGFNFLVKYAGLITYHAIKLAELDTSKPIEIITGLSIINWGSKDEFLNSIKTINVNNEVIEPTVQIAAQGQGVYFDYEGDKEDGDVCVVDIGYNTFDFLVFRDGVPQPDLSFATVDGANKIITNLRTKINKRFDINISEQQAKKIFIDKSIKILGTVMDLEDEIDEAKSDYADFIINELKQQGGDLLSLANAVIFSGGGAYFLDKDIFSGTENAIFSDKPYEFANVRGYYSVIE